MIIIKVKSWSLVNHFICKHVKLAKRDSENASFRCWFLHSLQQHFQFLQKISWRFYKPSSVLGGLGRGISIQGLTCHHCHRSRWYTASFFSRVCPPTRSQLRLSCHWNSAYLGFHSNSSLPRPSSISTWCPRLSWSKASVSPKDLLRKSLSGLSY